MTTDTPDKDKMLPDYKGLLKNGVRGKYAGRSANGHSVTIHYDGPPSAYPLPVKLDADVAAAFPNDRAVNDALRQLINHSQKSHE